MIAIGRVGQQPFVLAELIEPRRSAVLVQVVRRGAGNHFRMRQQPRHKVARLKRTLDGDNRNVMTIVDGFHAVLHGEFDGEFGVLRAQLRQMSGQLMHGDGGRGQHPNHATRLRRFKVGHRLGILNVSQYSLRPLQVALARLRERQASGGAV